jgi:hypothetical protein
MCRFPSADARSLSKGLEVCLDNARSQHVNPTSNWDFFPFRGTAASRDNLELWLKAWRSLRPRLTSVGLMHSAQARTSLRPDASQTWEREVCLARLGSRSNKEPMRCVRTTAAESGPANTATRPGISRSESFGQVQVYRYGFALVTSFNSRTGMSYDWPWSDRHRANCKHLVCMTIVWKLIFLFLRFQTSAGKGIRGGKCKMPSTISTAPAASPALELHCG